jgi:mono/diheme cytochrome c family protein
MRRFVPQGPGGFRLAVTSPLLLLVLAATARLTAGCTSSSPAEPAVADSGATTTPGSADLPCDVAAVLENRCAGCHGETPRFGAPMPLVTHADLVAQAKSDPSKKVYEAVLARIASDTEPMPPAPNARLSAEDRAALEAWVQAGAREGACSTPTPGGGRDGGNGIDDGKPSPLACADVLLRPKQVWEMPRSTPDEYVCYGVELDFAEKRHITAFAPRIDNSTIVHHVLLFQTDAPYAQTPQACSPAGQLDWRLIYGWAPGGKALELPAAAGFPAQGKSHYVVQVHYSNLNALSGERDGSGVDLCTTKDLRPNDAGMVAFGTMQIRIPRGETLDTTCDFAVPDTFDGRRFFSAFPHMHQLGTRIETELLPSAGGAPVDMGKQTTWSFGNQVWFPIDATLKAGDTVRTRCAWKNTSRSEVRFGEATSDEMCYSFSMYYPVIPNIPWMQPALRAQCRPTTQ